MRSARTCFRSVVLAFSRGHIELLLVLSVFLRGDLKLRTSYRPRYDQNPGVLALVRGFSNIVKLRLGLRFATGILGNTATFGSEITCFLSFRNALPSYGLFHLFTFMHPILIGLVVFLLTIVLPRLFQKKHVPRDPSMAPNITEIASVSRQFSAC